MRLSDLPSKGITNLLPMKPDSPHICDTGGPSDYHRCKKCQLIKKPIPYSRSWGGMSWQTMMTFNRKYAVDGHNPNIAAMTGRRAPYDGLFLGAIDHDHGGPSGIGPGKRSIDIDFYLDRKTLINFSPSGGWHDLFLSDGEPTMWDLEQEDLLGWGPCEGLLHKIIWDSSPYYILIEPSTINGRHYFWMDDGRQSIRRI